MIIFSILVLLLSIVTTSFGYKIVGCNQNSNNSCTVYMSPTEDTYKYNFTSLLDPFTAISLDFTFGEYEINKTKTLGILNNIIKDEVNQTTLQELFKKLNITLPKTNITVLMVEKPDNISIPTNVSKGPTTSEVVQSTIDTENSTAPEVATTIDTTTISTTTSFRPTKPRFTSSLNFTLRPFRLTYPSRTGIGLKLLENKFMF